MIDNSFLGHLKKKSLEMKKIRVLEIYRYLYRFSYFRAQRLIDNPIMMLVVFQYLLDTKMRRIHERPVLTKNFKAYYRCCENLINLSKLNDANLEAINIALGPILFETEKNVLVRDLNLQQKIDLTPL